MHTTRLIVFGKGQGWKNAKRQKWTPGRRPSD
jgi:hypothetical protein